MTTPQAAKTPGGGCLKGCLFGCLGLIVVLLVVAGGTWYGWHRWGRPWLANKEQAVARYVPAGLLPGVSGGTAGASGASGVAGLLARHLAPGHLAPSLPSAAGRTRRADLGADLWVPGAAGPAAYDTQPDGASAAVVRVEGQAPSALVTEARRKMKARGWTLVDAGKDGDGTALDFKRPGARARVGVYPRHGAVEVWVSRWASGGGSRSGSGAGSAP